MNRKEFKKNWESNLENYLSRKSVNDSIERINGYTRCNKYGIPARHGYIINKTEGECDLNIIKQYNILCHQDDFDKLIDKIHQGARHLNSSQVMCYNFFRNLMKKEIVYDKTLGWRGFASSKLVDFMKEKCGITISENAECFFEYKDRTTQKSFKEDTPTGRGENSQFDFFISENETQIYFEIKYTESNFSPWTLPKNKSTKSIDNHGTYLKEGYRKLIDASPNLTQDCKKRFLEEIDKYADTKIDFNKSYQLFRNVLKADDQNRYSIFIFPYENKHLNDQFELFKTNNLIPDNNHIIRLYWEDLSDFMSPEFKEKYISFLKLFPVTDERAELGH